MRRYQGKQISKGLHTFKNENWEFTEPVTDICCYNLYINIIMLYCHFKKNSWQFRGRCVATPGQLQQGNSRETCHVGSPLLLHFICIRNRETMQVPPCVILNTVSSSMHQLLLAMLVRVNSSLPCKNVYWCLETSQLQPCFLQGYGTITPLCFLAWSSRKRKKVASPSSLH